MFCDKKKELNFCNGYLSLLYFCLELINSISNTFQREDRPNKPKLQKSFDIQSLKFHNLLHINCHLSKNKPIFTAPPTILCEFMKKASLAMIPKKPKRPRFPSFLASKMSHMLFYNPQLAQLPPYACSVQYFTMCLYLHHSRKNTCISCFFFLIRASF